MLDELTHSLIGLVNNDTGTLIQAQLSQSKMRQKLIQRGLKTNTVFSSISSVKY